MTDLQPPLKWAGGKRWLVPRLRAFYETCGRPRLVEACGVGGMAVALGLQPREALLVDVNPYLINFYAHVKKGFATSLMMRNDPVHYYVLRERFNALIREGVRHGAELAEIFYYLNRTCFNGLCRFSKGNGEFNVPFGKYKTIAYRKYFSEYAPVMESWTLARCDFGLFADQMRPTDFVYLDPPFDGTFVDYSAGGFSWEDQERLARQFAAHHGPVVASNAATDRILSLYRGLGFSIEILDGPRRISCKGDREPAKEMLATKNLDRHE